MSFKFKVNGKAVSTSASPMTRLLDFLRINLKLTGAKEGCGEGECGACSVIVDGRVVNSCLIPICQLDGTSITTVEGISKNKKLTKLQKAFTEWGGSQCGICTPGFLLASQTLIKSKKPLKDSTIREALAGNLCRCTGYTKIFLSIKKSLRVGS